MDDLTLTLVQAGSMISTVSYMLSRGLDMHAGDLQYIGARPGLLLRSFLSVDVIVPLITVAIIILVMPAKTTAIGLLLLAASPVAPMALKRILQAGGNREYAIGLHFAMALPVIVMTPITIELISRMVGFSLGISPFAVAGLVGLSILLPICVGTIIARLFPAAGRQLIRPLEDISGIVSNLVNIVVLLSTYQLLLALDINSYIAIILVVTGGICTGHLMARGRPGEQAMLALESGSRNVDLTLLIVSTFTTLEKALPVIIPYIVISSIISMIYIWYVKKALQRPDGTTKVQHVQQADERKE